MSKVTIEVPENINLLIGVVSLASRYTTFEFELKAFEQLENLLIEISNSKIVGK